MILDAIRKFFKNHFVAMTLICAVPMVTIAWLSFKGTIGSWGLYALLLICPLGHLLMMRGMFGHHHDEKPEVTVPARTASDD